MATSKLSNAAGSGNPEITIANDSYGLSFCKSYETAGGRCVRLAYFVVPNEEYGAGWVTGVTAAAELLTRLRLRPGDRWLVSFILADVAAARAWDAEEPSRFGAACGFMSVIDNMLSFSATHADHEAWTAEKLAESRQCAAKAQARAAA